MTDSPHTSPAFATPVEDITWEQTSPDGTRQSGRHPVRHVGRNPATRGDVHLCLPHPAGFWDLPHSHSADAHLVIARGELRLGYGDRLDRRAAQRFPVGSLLHVPAGAVHFDGAEEETVLLGTAVGPWSTDYLGG